MLFLFQPITGSDTTLLYLQLWPLVLSLFLCGHPWETTLPGEGVDLILVLEEINTFTPQGCFKLIKSDSKKKLLKDKILINAVLLNFLLVTES